MNSLPNLQTGAGEAKPTEKKLGDLPWLGVRQLKQNASKVVAEVEADHRARVITVNGRPAVGLVPLASLATLATEVVAHSVERIGVASEVFAASMARFPVPEMSETELTDMLQEIRDSDTGEDGVDPWEQAGL